MRRLSRIRNPLFCRAAVAVWTKLGARLELHEARQRHFESLHAVFTRELKAGARSVTTAPGVLPSPCDGIVGACGYVVEGSAYQAKGFPYALAELLPAAGLAEAYRDGVFATLRLKPDMYHRFHSPVDGRLRRVTYVSGDTWNVNPVALKCIERLYCRNERAVVELEPRDEPGPIALVAVAAILVASIRLHGLEVALDARYAGPRVVDLARRVARGEELGYFEHGSTIIVFAPSGYGLCETLHAGARIRMGEPLLRVGGLQP